MHNADTWDEDAFLNKCIEKDNDLLKEQLGISADSYFISDNVQPAQENQFLQHIADFEETDRGPRREILSLFPENFEFPPVQSMNKSSLTEKMNEIMDILEEHNICIDLVGDLPDEQIYDYITKEVFHEIIPLEFPGGYRYHLDGCDGYCPECFQKPYCKTSEEIWKDGNPGNSIKTRNISP